jgi:hypothetical protein
MPTRAQLQSEAAWVDEFTPSSLNILAVRLAIFWDVPRESMGTKGNEAHLSGYHRSRRWIKGSRYAVSRTYSVSRTAGDRAGGDSNAVCALDYKPKTLAQLVAACRRLDQATRAGRLEKITEWYGTFNGEKVVGFDNISNRAASSDPSHLWHGHLSFDRGRVDESHADVFEVLTGDDDMTPEQFADMLEDPGKTGARVRKALRHEMWGRGTGLATASTVTAIAGKVDIDPAELEAITGAVTAGVLASADELVAAVLAALPDGRLTKGDVEDALKSVLRAGVDGP